MGETLPNPENIEELLTFHSFEVEDVESLAGEVVFDIKILPDRGGDCLSHRGVARELATVLDVDLIHDPLREQAELKKTDQIALSVENVDACPRYTATYLTGIRVKESPEWLKKRLSAVGQRPINNIVDATNYVMYALGQPMHAYDAGKFQVDSGKRSFGVRFARKDESVALLPEGGKGESRMVALTTSDLLIVDGATDTPVGLAGIKGGRQAELNNDTTDIIIEAATFDSATIRKTSRRLSIVTDASKRFENAPASRLPICAQQMVLDLILKIAGGEFVGMVDSGEVMGESKVVVVSPERVNGLLGLSLTTGEIITFIKRIGAEVTESSGSKLAVVAPWERNDLLIEEDYIEEVGRIYGLANIKSVAPVPQAFTEVNARQYYSEQVRQELMAVGFSEVITSSFQKDGSIQLQNALANDKSYVRENLISNINSVLNNNFAYCDLLGLTAVRVFEIGTVFEKINNSVTEHVALAIGVRTKGGGYVSGDDKLLAQGIKAVEKVLGTDIVWKQVSGTAELDLDLVVSRQPIPGSYGPSNEQLSVKYKAPSAYPAVARDIALWVTRGEQSEDVANSLIALAGGLLVRHTLFDRFEKEDRVSYAFRLVFQSGVRTLTDIEVNKIMEKIYEEVSKKGWEVR